MENNPDFTADFGMLCHTLFHHDRTLERMFMEGETSKDLFAALSGNLDRIGQIVYKEKWQELKNGIENGK